VKLRQIPATILDPDTGENVRSWLYGLAAAALAGSAPAQAEKAVPLEWSDRGKHPFMMAEKGEMAFGVVCSAVRPKYGSFDFVVISKRGSIPLRKGGEVGGGLYLGAVLVRPLLP